MGTNKKECHYCKGKGIAEIPTYWNDQKMDYETEEDDCPSCDGTGRIIEQGHTDVDLSDLAFDRKR